MMPTLTCEVRSNLELFPLENFSAKTLMVESVALRQSRWGSDHRRFNPILVPKGGPPRRGFPLVMILAGFTGNGPQYFAPRAFEENLPQVIDKQFGAKQAPRAIYVMVDAWTPWGGSQFVNSAGTGRFEDYIISEMVPTLREEFAVSTDPRYWCITGGSSGGYGALSLASRHPEIFSTVAALAPDSFFDQSLLPEIYAAAPIIAELGGVKGVWKELKAGRFMQQKHAHQVLNAVAMGLCYAPTKDGKDVDWPIDLRTGKFKPATWSRWLAHDPLVFLPKRRAALRKLSKIYLDVGKFDQYHLQFGARQMREIFRSSRLKVNYSEFAGNHFDLGKRRPLVWQWLAKIWKV